MFTKVRSALQVHEVRASLRVGAVEAVRRLGHDLQALQRDVLLAAPADAVDAVLDAVHGLVEPHELLVEARNLAVQRLARVELLRAVVGLRPLQVLQLDELPVAGRRLALDLFLDLQLDAHVNLRDVSRPQGHISVHGVLLAAL